MPVCVHCAYPTPHLYTTYKTKSNIRLTVSNRCSQFTDPLIEHPPIILVLDLILLKPRVFLHLLYNRGTKPLDATKTGTTHLPSEKLYRQSTLFSDLRWLALVSVIAEAGVRLVSSTWLERGNEHVGWGGVLNIVMMVLVEMLAQHIVTLGWGLLFLWERRWVSLGQGESSRPEKANEIARDKRAKAVDDIDGRKEDFLPMIIPLTIFYTSILPLLLNLLLSIWSHPTTPTSPLTTTIPDLSMFPQSMRHHAEEILGLWTQTDKIWAGTCLLGGMSSGFGLRVVLPTRPWQTTILVLAGWTAAACVSSGVDLMS